MRIKRFLSVALALMGGVASYAQTSPYTGSTVQEGDEFYLYNVESNMWLQENNRFTADWNTHGELGTVGFDVKLIANGSGWQIDPKFGHNNSMNGGNFYLDTGDPVTAWTFEPADVEGVSNAYRIKYNGEFLHATPSPEFKLIRNTVEERHTWQVVSRADRLAYMQTATADNPKDGSWMIRCNEFSQEDTRRSNWTMAGSSNVAWTSGRFGDDNRQNAVFETWGLSNMTLTQTLTDLPNGKYIVSARACYSPTAGNALNVNDLNAYNDGTLENHGFLFANDKQVPLKSIYSWQGTGTEAHFHSKNLDGTYVIDGVNQFSYTVANNNDAFYNEVEVTIIDGTLKLGVKVENANGSAWVLADKFRLTYLGPVEIDLSEYTDALDKAIADAEAFTGNTTDVLKDNLDKALAEAKAVRESTDVDELVAKTSALKNALDAAKAVDDSVLEETIALAKNESVDVTAAEDFVANGTDPAVLSTVLTDLRNARRYPHMETFEANFAGNEPVDQGEFYFYNVGKKMFFQHGSEWGTRSAVGMPGLLVTLEASGDGFKFHNKTLTSDGKYTNPDGFVDTGDQHVWKFKAVDGKPGVYNIVHQSDETRGMAWNPNGMDRRLFNHVDAWYTNLNDANAQWILVTKADRDALLDEATWIEPVDASYLVKGASATKWETDLWKGTSRWGDNCPDFAFENWNGGDKTDAYIELSGLKPGLYKLSVQGYYRDGTFENQVANAAAPVSFARLYSYKGTHNDAYSAAAATEGTVELPNILDGLNQAPGLLRTSAIGAFPDGCDQATELFELGLYQVFTVAEVGEDGKLVVGVMKERTGAPAGDWVVFDNIRLAALHVEKVLSDTEDNTAYLEKWDGEQRKVKIERSFVADTWNTVVVPFDMDAAAITENFGAGTKVAKLDNEDGEGVLHFVTTTAIEAGVPYLIKPATAATAVKAYTYLSKAQQNAAGETYDFVGIYAPTAPAYEDYFVAADNKLKKNTANTALKAFRGYFKAKAGAKALTGFDIDGETTGIITIDGEVVTGKVYNVNGQQMNAQSLQKGIYIVNGKKVVK